MASNIDQLNRQALADRVTGWSSVLEDIREAEATEKRGIRYGRDCIEVALNDGRVVVHGQYYPAETEQGFVRYPATFEISDVELNGVSVMEILSDEQIDMLSLDAADEVTK